MPAAPRNVKRSPVAFENSRVPFQNVFRLLSVKMCIAALARISVRMIKLQSQHETVSTDVCFETNKGKLHELHILCPRESIMIRIPARNHDLCPTSVAGDGAREGMVNDVAGVNIVTCVDVIMDAECDIEGVEERDGIENPD
jgi:hypothetical protein